MRTKTLLLTAALTAAGIASSMAQVYSVNAVGYVNVTLKKGYNLINNPLKNGGNTLIEILPANANLPADTFVVTWNSSQGTIGGLDPDAPGFYPTLGWDPAGPPLPPGKAFFIYIDPTTAPLNEYVVTFVGEVEQGNLSNPISGGGRYNSLGSQVPQSGRLTADLAMQGAQDDSVLLWDKTKNPPAFSDIVYGYYEGAGWSPDGVNIEEPVVNVGEGFFLLRAAAGPNAWTRSFSVNP